MIDPANPEGKPDFYLYRLMEILLPKAMIKEKDFPMEEFDEDKVDPEKDPRFNLKMVELWAQNTKGRKGWLKVVNL